MAREHPDVLSVFAERYRTSQAGRTGENANDFTLDYRELLKAARFTDGEGLVEAERRLREAAQRSTGRLSLDLHPRDQRLIHRVRLAREGGEAWLFALLAEVSPADQREALAACVQSHLDDHLPDAWKECWQHWIRSLADAARSGSSVQPLERDDLALSNELLTVLPRLLAWQEESLLRFASCMVCGSSKRLEQLQNRIESALRQLSEGTITTLEDLGITDKPRAVRLFGPLKLVLPEGTLDLGLLRGAVAISEDDLRRALRIECAAARVLTIENDTTFTELVKHTGDTLLIQTSYPGRAVLALFERLPEIECWHFGDSDPAGFDILRDLRARTGQAIRPLHMHYRPSAGTEALSTMQRQLVERMLSDPKMQDCEVELRVLSEATTVGHFEQEMLGPPTIQGWPFYHVNACSPASALRNQ
ncbi:MAG: Wadjet anti-phage system protein JetD domain-containing protein [Verrucomicrobiaceae bacterium]